MIGDIDKKFWENGKTIIGFDEAGRGPIAGDMFYALVELKPITELPFILKDSKKYKDPNRKEIEEKIINLDIINMSCVGRVSVEDINSGTNLNKLLYMGICNSLFEMYSDLSGDMVLFVDGNQYVSTIDKDFQYVKPKLDELSWSCAIASILAKNAQVKAMKELDDLYPMYGFAKHKGYGSKDHYTAIEKFGICPVHRKNWIK
jgi:ribonuclease HII